MPIIITLLFILFIHAPLQAAESPNIVMIISDDQAWTDFGFMRHPHIKTPHLDRLAQQSARYPNGYVPTSVCRPLTCHIVDRLIPPSARRSFQSSTAG